MQQNRGHIAHDLQQKFIAIATDLRQKVVSLPMN